MPSAVEVTPARWTAIQVLFDNGSYSVISGLFDGGGKLKQRSLGERWNGDGDSLGFPSQGVNPTWYVVPPFLAIPVLHGLLDELSDEHVSKEYRDAIFSELRRQISYFR